MQTLRERILQFYDQKEVDSQAFAELFARFITELNQGRIRAAEYKEGQWIVNGWVKKGILLGFRHGEFKDYSLNSSFRFFDKHTYPLHPVEISDRVRIVPGGSSVRTGSYLAAGVVMMPPAYVNVGAYVGKGSMIDSHALVGSCAQIGAHVHLSAAAQIGGVLEPVGAMPVIIEDDVLIGGNCGVYEGTIIKKGAVIGAGTLLTRSIPVYDLVNETVLRASADAPLTIPERAVVVPGTRPLKKSAFADQENLQIQCAMIVKYRDAKTDRATALEEALR
ncbi:2,3,4,5-tetrahydropyridine-2,6-dicarboxylate N-succinyltransferase [candidate division KSB1 bacterium]|nr:2,3,4,5-tetrahydropyridine-2,6-dicarboxylate N-succinyltransferase [candidate division KSB1 bacterium]